MITLMMTKTCIFGFIFRTFLFFSLNKYYIHLFFIRCCLWRQKFPKLRIWWNRRRKIFTFLVVECQIVPVGIFCDYFWIFYFCGIYYSERVWGYLQGSCNQKPYKIDNITKSWISNPHWVDQTKHFLLCIKKTKKKDKRDIDLIFRYHVYLLQYWNGVVAGVILFVEK